MIKIKIVSVVLVLILTNVVLAQDTKNILNQKLINAIETSNVELVSALTEDGADIEAKGHWEMTPLLLATARGNIDIVKLLIEKGANIEAKDRMGRTPLHISSDWNEIFFLLIEKGANIEAIDKWGKTPLHSAVWSMNTTAIKLILEKGGNIEAKDDRGLTALHLASKGRRT